MAAIAGLGGQWASARGHVGKLVLGLLVASCLLGGCACLLMQSHLATYERVMEPQVLLEVDKSYIAIPRGTDWKCRRVISDDCYALTATLGGEPIRVLAASDGPGLLGMEYSFRGRHQDLRTTTEIRVYLKKLGLRDTLVRGLSQRKDSPGCWESVLGATHLSVDKGGSVRLTGNPNQGVSRESKP